MLSALESGQHVIHSLVAHFNDIVMPRLRCVIHLPLVRSKMVPCTGSACFGYSVLSYVLFIIPLVPKLLYRSTRIISLSVSEWLYNIDGGRNSSVLVNMSIVVGRDSLVLVDISIALRANFFLLHPTYSARHPPSSTPCLHLIPTYLHMKVTKKTLQLFVLVEVYYYWYLGDRGSPLAMLSVLLSWY